MRWAGHVALWGIGGQDFGAETWGERDRLEDLGYVGCNIKWNGEEWAGMIWLKIGTDGGSLRMR